MNKTTKEKYNNIVQVVSYLDHYLKTAPKLKLYLNIFEINCDNLLVYDDKYQSEQKKLIEKIFTYPIIYAKISKYLHTTISDIDYLEKFSPEQIKYVTNLSTSDTKLLACAGSGKTRSIIGRVKFLSEFGLAKKENIYCITFSKHAATDFQAKVKKLFPSYDSFCVLKNFSTIDSLAKTILCRMKSHKSENVEILSIAFRNFLKNITTDEIETVKRFKQIDHLFIDEAQDLNEVQYDCAVLLKKHFGTNIHLIGDPNQNIYQFRRADSSYLMKHLGTVFELTLNFRSTNQIINFAEGLKPIPTTPSTSATNKNGPPVGILVNNRRTIQDMILQYIRWYSTIGDISEIAIICPTRGIKSRATTGLSVFFNFLNMNKIPINRLYDEAGIMADRAKDNEKKPGHVNLITYHGTKGLEYDVVFVMDFYHNLFNINPTESDHNIFKYLLYVACSRAINTMFVCVYNEENGGKLNHWMTAIDPSTYFIDRPVPIPKLDFRTDEGIPLMGITEILGNFTDVQLNEIDDILDTREDDTTFTYRLYKDHTKIDRNKDEALFGIFCEELFYLMYYLINKQKPRELKLIENFIKSTFVIIELEQDYQYIKKNIYEAQLSWADFDKMTTVIPKFIQDIIHKKFTRDRELYDYVPCKNDFLLIIEDNMTDIKNTYERYLNPESYQYDYKNILEDFFYLIVIIYAYGINHYYYINNHGQEKIPTLKNGEPLYSDMYIMIESRFSHRSLRPKVLVDYDKLHIHGEIDFIDETDNTETICEIKCVSSMSMKYYLQVFLYNFCYHQKQRKVKKIYQNKFRIINLLTGLEHNVIFSINPTELFTIIKNVCISGNLQFDSMKLVYDLETTGRIENLGIKSIKHDGFRTESKQIGFNPDKFAGIAYPEIIEIAIRDYDTKMIIYNKLIKPSKKVSAEITKITGITNEMLQNEIDFIQFKNDFTEVMKLFVHTFFLAHNGNGFDNKIMLYDKLLDPLRIEFIDTMSLIPIHLPYGEKLDEKNLTAIYQKIVGGSFPAHRAMSDVNALIRIMDKLKIIL